MTKDIFTTAESESYDQRTCCFYVYSYDHRSAQRPEEAVELLRPVTDKIQQLYQEFKFPDGMQPFLMNDITFSFQNGEARIYIRENK